MPRLNVQTNSHKTALLKCGLQIKAVDLAKCRPALAPNNTHGQVLSFIKRMLKHNGYRPSLTVSSRGVRED